MKGEFMFLIYFLVAQFQCSEEQEIFFTPKHTDRSISVESPRKSYEKEYPPEKEDSAKPLSRRIYDYSSDPAQDQKKSRHVRQTDFRYSCPICCFDVKKPNETHVTCHQGGLFKHGYHFACYKKMLEYNSQKGKATVCTMCRKLLTQPAKEIKKSRSDFDISYTETVSSIDSSFVEDRYITRYRSFHESNIMERLDSRINQQDRDRGAQFSEPFPSIEEGPLDFSASIRLSDGGDLGGCQLGKYRFPRGEKIVQDPTGNGHQNELRTTGEEVLDIRELRDDGLHVFGRLRNEPGWIMLKNLTNNIFYGQYQPENFFMDANLNAMHFGTHANTNSPARSNSEELESFHILEFELLSDFEDRGEVPFGKSQSKDKQSYQSVVSSPRESFNSETHGGEFPSGETTPEHKTFLSPANLNPLQSSLYNILISKPRGFSIDLDVFDSDKQRKDKLIAKESNREQANLILKRQQRKDKLITEQSREQANLATITEQSRDHTRLAFDTEDIKDALDLEMKRNELLKKKLNRPLKSSEPRNGSQSSQRELKPVASQLGYGSELNRDDLPDDEDAKREEENFFSKMNDLKKNLRQKFNKNESKKE